MQKAKTKKLTDKKETYKRKLINKITKYFTDFLKNELAIYFQ